MQDQMKPVQPANSQNQGRKKLRILIGICSCHRHWDKRAAVRETWMMRLPEGMMAVFFVGKGGKTSEQDVITLPTRDDYKGLPRKIAAFFQYALTYYDFDYLFKCDDDTYLSGERLLSLLEQNPDFVGSARWWPKLAGGGAGYLLSRKAVSMVAQISCPETGSEDLWVSRSLIDRGVKFLPSPRLFGACYKFPQGNDLITVHGCHPEILREIHRGIIGANDNPVVMFFYARHTYWQGSFKLLQNGIFIGGVAKPHGRWEFLNNGDVLLLRWFDWAQDLLQKIESGYVSTKLKLEFEKG
jgi:hypothetical protein